MNRAHFVICGSCCTEKCLPNFAERQEKLRMKLFIKAAHEPHHILHDIIPTKLPITQQYRNEAVATIRRQSQFIPSTTLLVNSSIVSKKKQFATFTYILPFIPLPIPLFLSFFLSLILIFYISLITHTVLLIHHISGIFIRICKNTCLLLLLLLLQLEPAR